MKSVFLSFGLLFIGFSLCSAQTKKIALRSHSGANSSFTIYVPDEFGLGPIDYRIPSQVKKKKCPINIKPITSNKIPLEDSLEKIQPCNPPKFNKKSQQRPIHSKPKPNLLPKKSHQTLQKDSTVDKTETVSSSNDTTSIKLTTVPPQKSRALILILLLSTISLIGFFSILMKPTVSNTTH
ncbi:MULTISPECIES: hypothetical protein [unclassified Aureispira]|uniref:hypothetical protein n=1 Tax=unclassified Aureispira TaxID=2649989 RepID=UPI0006968694|nr:MULTISPECIES: hypothetical protein [unclassified Aureispira]WMX15570.1 hypothetical protein QP953_04155 [Aureispira sp. CCB-E]